MRPVPAVLLRAAASLAAIAFLAGVAWYGHDALGRRPISAVRFTGDTARVGEAALERLAAGLRGRESGQVDLAAVRDAARRLPWVRESAVRRVFPGTLEISIEAHQALARWDDSRLVSVRGEVFAVDHDGELPRFAGPEGAAAEMAAAWAGIRADRPVGVMPGSFRFPLHEDIWLPLRLDATAVSRGDGPGLEVIGRLQERTSHAMAQAELTAIPAGWPESIQRPTQRSAPSYGLMRSSFSATRS